MKKWLYFSTLIMAVLISIIISNSNLTLASEESNEVNLTLSGKKSPTSKVVG